MKSIENSKFLTKNDFKTTYKNQAKLRCNLGYELEGTKDKEMIITCSGEGMWFPLPLSCIIVDCGRPDDIKFGRFQGNKYSFGEQVIYLCNAGYEIQVQFIFLIKFSFLCKFFEFFYVVALM